jgi:hypothetical protein
MDMELDKNMEGVDLSGIMAEGYIIQTSIF